MNIFPELLNIHATLIADFPKSGSASFQGMDGYALSDSAYDVDRPRGIHATAGEREIVDVGDRRRSRAEDEQCC
jgi:hypothetical protein